MARKFFYVCAAMLMLALSYHFGFSTASAQAPGNPIVAVYSGGSPLAIAANGDCYLASTAEGANWLFKGNVFAGGPTPARQESWGQLKSRYAPMKESPQPGSVER